MIEVRPATAGDAAALTDIAFPAKRHWGYPEEWVEMWRQDLAVDEGYIDRHSVYVAVIDHDAIGFYAVAQTGETQAELEHMWVLPAVMGQGAGRALLDRALRFCREEGIVYLLVASDPNAAGFYEKLGAVHHGRINSTPAPRTLPVLRFEI